MVFSPFKVYFIVVVNNIVNVSSFDGKPETVSALWAEELYAMRRHGDWLRQECYKMVIEGRRV